MKDLTYFQVPVDGTTTVCEVDGKLQSMNYEYANVAAFTTTVSNHPLIRITRDMLQPYCSGEEAKHLFLPVQEPFLKRLVQTYCEEGFTDALQLASNRGPLIVKIGAFIILKAVESYAAFRERFSVKFDDNLAVIESCSLSRCWSSTIIRCIAWHSYCSKIAVATSDDCVRVYSISSNIVPQLKCKEQKNITCISWRPLSNSEIAVGCENGIIVWDVDPNSVATRLSINNAVILYRIDHKPVVTLAWSWRGDLLATGAGYDSAILVWNVDLKDTSSLKRVGASGNSLIKWSPVGTRLFSASTGIVFRVWECCMWQCERWTLPGGRVQSACWSPCGSIVLFTTTEEPMIYALTFMHRELISTNNSKDSANKVIPAYDVTKVDIEGLTVGGIVQNMDWDPSGHNLAVLFKETNYIALFKVTIYPVLQLNPSGLIVGLPEANPIAIEFQKNFEEGACLTIAWSTGRIQYFPIVYIETSVPSVPIGTKNCNESSFNYSCSGFKSPNLSLN